MHKYLEQQQHLWRTRAASNMRVRSKQEEYQQIADLTGFHYLKEMLEAEALVRARKNKTKKKKKKKKKNKPVMLQVQKDELADGATDDGQASKDGAVETVSVQMTEEDKAVESVTVAESVQADSSLHKGQASKDGVVEAISVQMTEEDEVVETVTTLKTRLVKVKEQDKAAVTVEVLKKELLVVPTEIFIRRVDATVAKEQVDTTEEITKTLLANNRITSAIEIDPPLPYFKGCSGDVEMVPTKSFTRNTMKGKSSKNGNVNSDYKANQGDTCEGMEKESFELKDNLVLRRLLRRPRYFDPSDNFCKECPQCGQEGHTKEQCTIQKQQKPCFICASFLHIAKRCRQKCSICKGGGHQTKYCLEKDQERELNPHICLRCGNSGHSMFSCRGDYSPDDLKDIQCYVCKNFSHLCCVDFPDTVPRELSCFSCGQSGHLGSECKNNNCFEERGGLVEQPLIQEPALHDTLVKEGGHFAQSEVLLQDRQRADKLATYAQQLPNKMQNLMGYQYCDDFVDPKECKQLNVATVVTAAQSMGKVESITSATQTSYGCEARKNVFWKQIMRL